MDRETCVAEQLTEIYGLEWWHKARMVDEVALNYHKQRVEDGSIYAYEEDGRVLGYYERYVIGKTCFLHNVYVKEDYRNGRVFKALYKHFFKTMPSQVTKIVGESQKLGGKLIERKVK